MSTPNQKRKVAPLSKNQNNLLRRNSSSQFGNSWDFIEAHGEHDLSCLEKVPVINFLYDLLDSSITPTGIEGLLNTVSLVSALMFTVVAAVPMSFSYEENMASLHRFSNTTDYKAFNIEVPHKATPELAGRELLNKMHQWCTYSMMCLMDTLIISIIVLFSLHSTSFRGPSFMGNKISQEMFSSWWKFMRWLVFLALILALLGIIAGFASLLYIYILKAPDFSCIGLARKQCYTWKIGLNHPWGTFNNMGWITLFYLGFIGTMLVGSMATLFKRRKFEAIRDRETIGCRDHELFGYISKACSGADGIEEDRIYLAVYILMSDGYDIRSLEEEFAYINWSDYSDFPVRVKQRLKMKLSV